MKWRPLLLILIASLLIRLYANLNLDLWIDEIFTINASHSILKYGIPMLESGYLYLNNILPVYINALSLIIFEFSAFEPFVIRVPFILISSFVPVALYVLVNKIFNDKGISLLVALLSVMSYSDIARSGQIRGYGIALLLTIVALYYLYLYVYDERGNRWHILVSILAYSLAAVSHWSALAMGLMYVIVPFWRKLFGTTSNFIDKIALLITINASSTVIILAFYHKSPLLERYFWIMLPSFIIVILSVILCGVVRRINRINISRLILVGFMVLFLCVQYWLYAKCDNRFCLDSTSPQPSFVMAMNYLKSAITENDAIIVAHISSVTIPKLYLNKNAYSITTWRGGVTDFYTGLKSYISYDQVYNLTNSEHGYFMVIGQLVHDMSDRSSEHLKDSSVSQLVYFDGREDARERVWIYRF